MRLDIYDQKAGKRNDTPVKIGSKLSLANGSCALAMDDDKVVIRLERAQVDDVHADGMTVSGFEYLGVTASGRGRHEYRRWWCAVPKDGQ